MCRFLQNVVCRKRGKVFTCFRYCVGITFSEFDLFPVAPVLQLLQRSHLITKILNLLLLNITSLRQMLLRLEQRLEELTKIRRKRSHLSTETRKLKITPREPHGCVTWAESETTRFVHYVNRSRKDLICGLSLCELKTQESTPTTFS